MMHIARGSIVTGDIVTGGALRLDGRCEGTLSASRVDIGPDGYLIGSIHADEVIVAGQVLGPIRARKVVIGPTALVEGDITHKIIALDEGAILLGECIAVESVTLPQAVAALAARMAAEDAAIDEPPQPSRHAPDSARGRIVRTPAALRLHGV